MSSVWKHTTKDDLCLNVLDRLKEESGKVIWIKTERTIFQSERS